MAPLTASPSPVQAKLTRSRLFLMLIVFLFSCSLLVRFDFSLPHTVIQNIFNPLIDHSKLGRKLATEANSTSSVTSSDRTTTTTSRMTVNTLKRSNISEAIQNSNTSDQPKEAFVTFCNNEPSYLALLEVFLDSVHAFSTRPVIAYGIDVDLKVDSIKYPRLIKRRIAQNDCGPSVYFCKIHAIISSNLDYGVLMETDDVVNYNIDVLFDVLHVWPYPVPLSPRHPDDPQNYDHFMKQLNVSKRTTPYLHAHMIWTHRALPFLQNIRSLLRRGHFNGANYDESAVNVMLWKAKADHTLCKYDPYFTYITAYESWPKVEDCSRYCHTVFLTLHGSKDAKTSAEVLGKLKTMKGKPTVQTQGMGGFHHLNDTRVTCCYPDSERSPIHPLLCKHVNV